MRGGRGQGRLAPGSLNNPILVSWRGLRSQPALVAFGTGLALIAVVLAVLLSHAAPRRTGMNGIVVQLVVGEIPPGATGCQPREVVGSGTGAVRLWISNPRGDRLRVRAALTAPGLHVSTPVTTSRAAGLLTLPLSRQLRSDSVARLCIQNLGAGPLALNGQAVGGADQMVVTAPGGRSTHLVGRVRVAYLTAAPEPLWDVLRYLPERFEAATGSPLAPWLVLIGALGTLGGAAMLLREVPGRRSGRELLIVVLTSFAAGAFWAGLTPALQKTDEPAHFAYVQAVAELGHPPTQLADKGLLSPEFACWYYGLRTINYRFDATERPPWSTLTSKQLERSCDGLSRRLNGAMYQAWQPPLYYELGAIGYRVGSGLPLPSRLLLTRLVSALIGAAYVALIWLLVRELVPGSRWATRLGALAVLLEPVVMYNLSGVNPDGLYSAAAVGLLLLAARAWRRGLSWWTALGMGAFVGVGLLSKANFLAVLPSLVLVAIALWWGPQSDGRGSRAVRLLAGAALAAAMFGVYVFVNAHVWHRGLLLSTFRGSGGSLGRLLSFTWQFFLPRWPGMRNWTGISNPPVYQDFIRGIVSRLGWWDAFGLAGFWIPVLLVCAFGIAVLGARYLGPRIRRRPWPAAVAALAALVYLGALVYSDYKMTLGGLEGMEPRYLLPVFPLWSVVVGAAVAGARPRLRPYLAGAMAALFLAHTVIAVGATLQHYYL